MFVSFSAIFTRTDGEAQRNEARDGGAPGEEERESGPPQNEGRVGRAPGNEARDGGGPKNEGRGRSLERKALAECEDFKMDYFFPSLSRSFIEFHSLHATFSFEQPTLLILSLETSAKAKLWFSVV